MIKKVQSLGIHLIVELYDCHREIINDARSVEDALINAVNISGAKISGS